MPSPRTKESVSYGKGNAEQHCGICVHFIKPGTCKLVEGRISSRGWCRLFEKGKT